MAGLRSGQLAVADEDGDGVAEPVGDAEGFVLGRSA
jgi:hypothetical protein